jgi:acyl-CoA thioester hydrolase
MTQQLIVDHCIEIQVKPDDIDVLGHVNNCEYLKWLEQAAWSHCEALGLNFAVWQQLGAAWVARRTEIEYLTPALLDDRLLVETGIVDNSQKTSMVRGYRILRPVDNKSIVTASTQWICVNLATGRPMRMPPAFVAAFPAR